MHVLLIGGAGAVGRALVPQLARVHQLTVLDRVLAESPEASAIVGDARDFSTLGVAMEGIDAVVHLAAAVPRGAEAHDAERIRLAFDVNVAGVYLALRVATERDVRSFVHMSSMSVFADYGRVTVDASSEPDSTEPYGQSKRLAEHLCAASARDGRMSVTSLRLALPTTDQLWPMWRSPGTPDAAPIRPALADGTMFNALAPSDLGHAVEAALVRRGPYAAVAVTGDVEGVTLRNDRTADILGWRPLRR